MYRMFWVRSSAGQASKIFLNENPNRKQVQAAAGDLRSSECGLAAQRKGSTVVQAVVTYSGRWQRICLCQADGVFRTRVHRSSDKLPYTCDPF